MIRVVFLTSREEESVNFKLEENTLSAEVESSWKHDKAIIDLKNELIVRGDYSVLELLQKLITDQTILNKIRKALRPLNYDDLVVSYGYFGYTLSFRTTYLPNLGDENYLYHLPRFLFKDEFEVSLKPEQVVTVRKLIEELGVERATRKIVDALTAGGLEWLNHENPLRVVKNQIDELLNLLLNENVNKFQHPFVFKVDEQFVITTGCCTEFYVVKNGKLYANGVNLVRNPRKVVDEIPSNVEKIIPTRLKELKEALGLQS